MGLFDKKYCDVCGEKIGLLGNRKLEDGNLCKDCAKKLSPFFNERRHSTVVEIKQQLAYREENISQLEFFYPTRTLGNDKKIHIDERNGKFIVTSSSNWKDDNPDIINLTQVTSVNVDIEEDRDEIKLRDSEGNYRSYNPPRYEYEYRFNVEINVDSPYFNVIEFELTKFNSRPDSKYSDLYRSYEHQVDEIKRALMPSLYVNQPYAQPNNFAAQQQMPYQGQQGGFVRESYSQQGGYQQPMQQGYPQQGSYQQSMRQGYPQQGGYQQPIQQGYPQQGVVNSNYRNQNQVMGMWVCQNCSTQNTGKFCERCGCPLTQSMNNNYNTGVHSYRCDKCGWIPSEPNNIPRFCPQCGDSFDENDID